MLLQVNNLKSNVNKYRNMICCLFRIKTRNQISKKYVLLFVQVRPSGEEATAAAIRAIVSMVGIFVSVFVFFSSSVFLSVFLVRISVGISFSQYLGKHFLGCIFFGTAWFLGSVYCQWSLCKLEKYVFPSIEKRISF